MKKIMSLITIFILTLTFTRIVRADSVSVDFENPPYIMGVIDGIDSWNSKGAAGSGCGVYDHKVDTSLGFGTFGSQSLRISNAVTSGCFGDQTFAKPLTDSVGEVDATIGTYSEGTRKTHYEAQFDIGSTMTTQQSGQFVSISPDRGDGSRMSYLGFSDAASGIDVIFYDVQGTSNPANFVPTTIATLDRSSSHTAKFVMDMVDGPSNDVVKIYIDGVLTHTGTSWENYYRYDAEAGAEPSPRIIKTLLFRTGGTAVPANVNKGFLFDNLSMESLTPLPPSVPVITLPTNGASVTQSNMVKVDWSDSTGGTYTPYTYQYEAFADAGYTSLIYNSSWLSVSEIPTPGTPIGDYYLRVRAKDNIGQMTEWSNGVGNTYLVHVIADGPVLVGPPTNKDQCKKDGWKTFNNPTFKNQGECVSYVNHHDDHGEDDEHEYEHERLERLKEYRRQALERLREVMAELKKQKRS